MTPPNNITAPFHTSVELSCIATGNRQQTILWYKDKARLFDAAADPSASVKPLTSLEERSQEPSLLTLKVCRFYCGRIKLF